MRARVQCGDLSSCALRQPQYPMRLSATPLVLAMLLAVAGPSQAGGDRKTVCTITVNSPDEKDAFRRDLPADKYRFVELVERGRPDWLAVRVPRGRPLRRARHLRSLRRRQRVLLRSRRRRSEFLPVDEMERVSCSDSCPGALLAAEGSLSLRLQHAEPGGAAQRIGRDRAQPRPRPAIRAPTPSGSRARSAQRHGESSRDRMRLVFKDVPAIYGFSSVAPLGPVAGVDPEPVFPGGRRERGRHRPRHHGPAAGRSSPATRWP